MIKKFVFIILSILLCSVASAEVIDYFKNGDVADILIPCELSDAPCPTTVLCNITLHYPNGTVLVDNQYMSHNVGFYNYTITETDKSGEYMGNSFCSDGTYDDVYSFSIFINNSGEQENDFLYIGFFIILVGIIFAYLYAGFNVDDSKFGVKITLFFTAFFNIIGALLSTILIQTSWLTLYQISEVLLWLNGLLIVIMGVYYIYYVLTKNMDDIENI